MSDGSVGDLSVVADLPPPTSAPPTQRLDQVVADLHVRHPTSDGALLRHHGRWEDHPHQHLPSARLSASPWSGFLVADEVGLGKTISAIHHLRTLHARGRSGGCLIVCPGGIRTKWLDELRGRADLIGHSATSGKELLALLDRVDAGEPLTVVTSHGVLRRSELLSTMAERGLPRLMLTIVDEAHHVRNPSTRLHDAVQLLALASDELLLLTATPVNLDEEELWVQLSLCAPDRWPDAASFRRLLRPLRQLNEALDGIARTPPAVGRVRQALHQLRHTPGFDGDPRLDELWDLALDAPLWADDAHPDTVEAARTRAADLLRQLRPFNTILARTRRQDADLPMAERHAITLDVTLTESERRLYTLARRWSQTLWQLRHPDGGLMDWALLIPERMASSCLPAFARHVIGQLRDHARGRLELDREDSDDATPMSVGGVEWRLLRRLGDLDGLLAAAEALGDADSKWSALWSWLSPHLGHGDGGVLIFSQFLGTLDHLKGRLESEGVAVGLLTGAVPWAQREVLYRAHREGRIDVLLSSEVGGEGLDLQHCHRMVNVDLPWNPMRIEQRIGRIDRFGQLAPRIDVLNIAVEGTIDAAILSRLYDRIRLFEDTLGMLDPLLGQAMRAVALEALRGDVHMDTEGSAESLLEQRKRWLSERATAERATLGPDPGIGELRAAEDGLGAVLEPQAWVTWLGTKLQEVDAEARLIAPSQTGGLAQLRLGSDLLAALKASLAEPGSFDRQALGWSERLEDWKAQPLPAWVDVATERSAARAHPEVAYLAPWHPIAQLLRGRPMTREVVGQPRWTVDQWTGAEDICWQGVVVRPAAWPDAAAWMVVVDWSVEALGAHHVRRWLVLDGSGRPLEAPPDAPWSALGETVLTRCDGRSEVDPTLSRALDELEAELRSDETALLTPLAEELAFNIDTAWQGRVARERLQLAQAEERARHTGEPPDPRWVRMKQGLIRRLQDERSQRLAHLETLRDEVAMRLEPRIAVRLTSALA